MTVCENYISGVARLFATYIMLTDSHVVSLITHKNGKNNRPRESVKHSPLLRKLVGATEEASRLGMSHGC